MNEQERSVEVTRTYLELSRADAHKPDRLSDTRARIERITNCPASFYRYLYSEVGRFYHWVDRLPWTDEETNAHLARPEIKLWAMYADGAPAGYFELELHDDRSIEIAYFGLLPEFIGRGLGKLLLAEAVNRAWDEGAARVWLHTCTLDDPAAMANYIKGGFKPFKQEKYFTTISLEEERRGRWLKQQ